MSSLLELTAAVVAVLAGVIAIKTAIIACRFATAKNNDFQSSKNRYTSKSAALTGDVRTHEDGRRDYRVSCGLAVQTKSDKREWVQQGLISDEALDLIIAPRPVSGRH